MDVLGDIDSEAKHRLELLLELDLVNEAAPALTGDEKVDLARRSAGGPPPWSRA